MKNALRFIRMDYEYAVYGSGTIKTHFMTILDMGIYLKADIKKALTSCVHDQHKLNTWKPARHQN